MMRESAIGQPPRVKICGITNLEDAGAAIKLGADALGFNLYPGSKRHVRIGEVAEWVAPLKGRVLRVAVMVNPTAKEVREAQEAFDAVQLHGHETPAFCAALAEGGVLWKALPLTPDLDAAGAGKFAVAAWLLDAFVPGEFGGTGRLIDLPRAAAFIHAAGGKPVWLSGGLTPENVGEAVRRTHPYGVDVASGVEMAGDPRRKDARRMRAFIRAARGGQGGVGG